MLKLVVNKGVRILDIDEKRTEIEQFFKAHYRDAQNRPLQIHPSHLQDPADVDRLYKKTRIMEAEMYSHYLKHPDLLRRYEYRRGLVPQTNEKKNSGG